MSKSLGNGIDPMEVVDRFGADALRFTVISACGIGTDIHLDHEDLEAAFAPGRNFANKLWNAGRFTLMSVGEEPVQTLAEVEGALTRQDRWILSRLSRTSAEITRELERFRLHDVAERAYHFFWGDFADWYLELVKPRLRGEDGEESRQAARATLVAVFDGTCRLLHPLVPFVTEALWERLPWPEGKERPEALMIAPWPEPDPAREDKQAEDEMGAFQELITQIRSLRKEYGVPEKAQVKIELSGGRGEVQAVAEGEADAVCRLARVEEVSLHRDGGGRIGATAVLRDGAELFVPLEGVIDLDRERSRIEAEIDDLGTQLSSSEKKLENKNFVERAPEEVVERERAKAEDVRNRRETLRRKLTVLEGA